MGGLCDPQFLQGLQGAGLPNGDKVHPVGDKGGEDSVYGTPDGPHPLAKEHHPGAAELGQDNNPQVVKEGTGTGHILEDAAPAAEEEVSLAQGPDNPREIGPVYGLNLVLGCRQGRVAGNDRQLYPGHKAPQGTHHGGKDGLIPGIVEAKIAGDDNPRLPVFIGFLPSPCSHTKTPVNN